MRRGIGVNQVGDGLRRDEVHPPMFKRAPGELPGTGQPGPGLRDGFEYARHHGGPPVQVQLDHVLAGEALWPRHEHDQRFVQCFT